MFYEAQLSIYCVDGMLYGCQGHDIKQMLTFLLKYDHEGSSISLTIRRNPESFETIYDPEMIYRELGYSHGKDD